MAKAVAYTGQWLDESAPRAWAEALAWHDFNDACAAVAALGARPMDPGKAVPPILPGHVVYGIHQIRARRVADFDPAKYDPPPELDPSDVPAYLAWVRRTRELAASGNPPPRPELPARPTGDVIAKVRRALSA